MPQIDYKPLANNPGANVESQAQYELDLGLGGSLVNGYQSGLAHSNQFNKTLRQSSMVSAAVATFIANIDGLDVLDNGDLPALVSRLAGAIGTIAGSGAWSTGDVKLTMKTAADAGWLMCNDQTIGDASSGATYANAAAQPLFLLLWNNVINTWAPVFGGRGGSAAADWAAHKRISLTAMMGRALAISGAGSGLSSRALGEYAGEEATALIAANNGAHTHGVTDPGHNHTAHGVVNAIGYTTTVDSEKGGTVTTSTNTTGISVQTQGSGTPHNTMQPTAFLRAMIKL